MPTIHVARGFVFNHGDRREEFPPGDHDVPEEVASHWFTQAHLVGVAEPAPLEPSYEEKLERALAAVHNADPTKNPGPPVVESNAVELLHQPGSVDPRARYFAGKEQVDRLLPGQVPPPHAVSYGKIPR